MGIQILKVVGWREEAKTPGGMQDSRSLFWILMYVHTTVQITMLQ